MSSPDKDQSTLNDTLLCAADWKLCKDMQKWRGTVVTATAVHLLEVQLITN